MLAAPAIVHAGNLMPIRGVKLPLVVDRVYYVSHKRPNAFRTIQAALDHLKSFGLPGEPSIMQIDEGHYFGPLVADRHPGLYVRGQGSKTIVTTTDEPHLQAYNNSILSVEAITFNIAPRKKFFP
jgi:pectin methylesterase-like acyl-CoA thioesterase